MTTHFTQTWKCAHCGSAQDVTVLGSTNAFGSMDLDMRPPPMERDTLSVQIHQCAACGFCAGDLESSEGVDLAQVGKPEYLAILEDERFPNLANRFRAFAYLATAAGSPVPACWGYMRAAWVCDDAGTAYGVSAASCRRDAVKTFDLIHAKGLTLSPDTETDEVLRLDLLRRAGDFQSVIDAATKLRGGDLPDILDRIANFQAEQAELGVTSCFTVDDAIGD
jgi:hypothetical protein